MARPVMRNTMVIQSTDSKEVIDAMVAHSEQMEQQLAHARVIAEMAAPSFIPGLRTIHIVMTNALPTAGIDKYWRVYWNPDFVQLLIDAANSVSLTNPCPTCKATSHHPLAYLGGLWIHEAGHMIFDHGSRFKEFVVFETKEYKQRWNICTDAEMNDDIPAIGAAATASKKAKNEPLPQLCLPSRMMVDEQARYSATTSKEYWDAHKPVGTVKGAPYVLEPFGSFPADINEKDGDIAEHYFERWEEKQEEKGKKKKGDKGEKGDKSDEEGEGEGEEGEEGEGKPGKGKGKFKGPPGNPFPMQGDGDPDNDDHGSGVDGVDRPWEAGDPLECETPGTSKAEALAVRRNVAAEIKKQKEKGYGHIPGGWDIFADAMLTPAKVRWQDVLHAKARQAITKCAGERMNTYRRLSRASIVHRKNIAGSAQKKTSVVKPSTYDVVPTVIVVVDTSGSMGSGRRSRLESALCEAEGILKFNKVKGYFLDCDAKPYGTAQEVQSVKKARISGGGGTDMRAGVLAAKGQKMKPDIIVLITDGDTPWPSADEVKGLKIITAIIHERDTNGCPEYMNPVHVPVND